MHQPYQQLKIFLSSTFRDMQKERDSLVKLFRQLAHEGSRRGVDIKLIDLRWGVTDDQKRNGQVILTCLKEIDNSKPFFIGMVGDRYGWIPDEREIMVSPELAARYPDILKYTAEGLSITEIEMRFGVLDRPQDATNSLFLVKKGHAIENERHASLIELLTSKRVNHFVYRSIAELEATAKKSLLSWLDSYFPVLTDIPEWQRFEIIHTNIATSKRKDFIEFGDYIERLDRWTESPGQHLIISGCPGSGKTTLIAGWLSHRNFEGYKVACHFIGNSLAEGTPVEIQRHFLTLLEHEYNLPATPAKKIEGDDDYSLDLERALEQSNVRGDKWLLIMDGLDHLKEDVQSKLLMWMPDFPDNVKVLYSTVDTDLTYQRLHDALGYEVLELHPLSHEEIETIVSRYLANFGKALDLSLIEKIADCGVFSNSFLLNLLLDELITYGVHEEIGHHIDDYSKSSDNIDFLCKIIRHTEQYYGERIVKDFVSSIAISKSGLSEKALAHILNLDDLQWATLSCGMQKLFVYLDGKYRMATKDLHDALDRLYDFFGVGYDHMLYLSKKIIDYFTYEDYDPIELAFQYSITENLEQLHELLLSGENTLKLILDSDLCFARYWTLLLDNTDYTMSEYLDVDFQETIGWDEDEQLNMLANIITIHFSDFELSVKLREKAIDILLSKNPEDKATKSIVAGNYDLIAQENIDMGEFEQASKILHKAERLYKESGENDSFHMLISGNLAMACGDYEEALDLFLNAIETDSKQGDYVDWKCYNNAGLAYSKLELYDEALEMYNSALTVIKQGMIENTVEGATVLNNIGLVYLETARYDDAESCFNRALEIFKLNTENPGPQISMMLLNLATVYRGRENTNTRRALEYLMEALRIQEGLDNPYTLALIQSRIGSTYIMREEYPSAIEWLSRAVSGYWSCQSIYHPDFITALRNLLDAFIEIEYYKEAMESVDAWLVRHEEEGDSQEAVAAYMYYWKAEILSLSGAPKRKIIKELKRSRTLAAQFDIPELLEDIEEALGSLQ